ncbi:hypothetical protein [Nitrospira sp. Nam74]
MTKRKVRRINANIPAIIIERWEDLLKRENGYLPFNLSQRLELAILEHTRLIERRLKEQPDYTGESDIVDKRFDGPESCLIT